MKPIIFCSFRNASALALLATASAAIAEPGDMMHMTISGKMQISEPAMAMAIPTFNKDVCSPKQVDVRNLMTETSRNKQCAYTNYKQVGNTVSFHYTCSGAQQLDGDGSFTIEGNGVQGTIHANGDMHGSKTVVDMRYEGTRTSTSCDYTPPKAAQ